MWRRLQELVARWRGSEVAIGPKSTTRAVTTIAGLCTGEALVGEGSEIAHIDLIMGPRGSAAEKAFANSLTNNKDGFTSLLAVIAPNLMVKPPTVMFNKVTIKDAKQAVQMFGPAQHAVAKAVADSVAEGVIPRDQADDLFIPRAQQQDVTIQHETGRRPRNGLGLRSGYSPIVRMTLLSGRVLFDDSLSSCASISSYFGTVVTSPFGTMCTTL
jgi:formaldehyde-activating enzyme